MPEFKIQHITRYTYEGPVRDSANQIILFPIKDEYQDVVKQELTITGDPVIDTYIDYYGNEVGSFTYSEPHSYVNYQFKNIGNYQTQATYPVMIFFRHTMGRPEAPALYGALYRFFKTGIF